MTFDPDDPRLSAHALGELEPAEAVEVEAMLAASPEARAALEEIRAAAWVLTTSLAREAAPGLGAPQRLAIESRLKSRRRLGLIAGLGTLAAAACALLAVRLTLGTPDNEANMKKVGAAVGKSPTAAPRTTIEAYNSARVPLADNGGGQVYSDSGLAYAPAPAAKPAAAPSALFANSQRGYANAPAPSGPSAPQQYGYAGGGNADPQQAAGGRVRAMAPGSAPEALGRSEPAKPAKAGDMGGAAAPVSGVTVFNGAVASAPRAFKRELSVNLAKPAIGPSALALAETRRMGGMAAAEPLDKQKDLAKTPALRQQEAEQLAAAPAPLPPTVENPFVATTADPLSTFAVDVDTASYTQVRKALRVNMRPDPDAVRVEEMINYFSYKYPQPTGDDPFSVTADVARCPWDADHRLVRIGLKGRDIDLARRPASNLVFLLDVSGSMDEPDKLPLVKQAMGMLVERLGENDRVSMVVYAGASGVALPPTRGDRKPEILSALEELKAGGSTNGGAGIKLAYDLAAAQFIKGGVNRVILCTDGDFNVGTTGIPELESLIEQRRKTGVFLSVLGFGLGDGKNNAGAREVDRRMEGLADKGNGNYASIDDAAEARKVLVEQMGATLVTIAKDVKIQVVFNPAKVASARLIGYENRRMAHADFRNDAKDAGEIGAGHTVTALYEVVPAAKGEVAALGLRYGRADDKAKAKGDPSEKLLSVRVRYKAPDGDVAKEQERGVIDGGKDYAEADDDYKFAAAVAAFGMLLRDSPYKGQATFDAVLEWAGSTKGVEEPGSRREFLDLVRKAKAATGR